MYSAKVLEFKATTHHRQRWNDEIERETSGNDYDDVFISLKRNTNLL